MSHIESNPGRSTPACLPAGTIVKHGTSSTKLLPIFKRSLQVTRPETLHGPKPKTAGVYVGGTIAYHAAVVAFSAEVSRAFTLAQMGTIEPLPKLAPVVIQFELAEDVPIVADEDFLLLDRRLENGDLSNEHLPELEIAIHCDGLKTWKDFGAAAIVRSGGIPSEWIRAVEFPPMLRALDGQPDRDIDLMLLAWYQHENALTQESLIFELEKRGSVPQFSVVKERRQITESNIKTWFPRRAEKSLEVSQAWLNRFTLLSMKAGLPVNFGMPAP